jgi:8-oxo-dGTP diphosphatase
MFAMKNQTEERMVRVVAGVIEKGGKVLIVRRGAHDRLAGKWEFPGGKIEPGETPEGALRRELREELAIETEAGAFLCSSTYEYPHIAIELLAYKVRHVSGEIILHVHDSLAWVSRDELDGFDFPEANRTIIEVLRTAGN